jgi:hypothetical protein
VAASTVAGLLLLEAGVRLAKRGGGKEDNARAAYVVSDPLLGWRKRPGARAVYQRREYATEVRINALGMRDPERGVERPPGRLRILALGDSFVEGYTVAAAASLPRRLEAQLEDLPCPVEVLNGGTSGWSTDQEFLYYREEAWRLGAHVVLVFLYYNDVLANVHHSYWGLPKPVLEEVDGRLEIAPARVTRAKPSSGSGSLGKVRAVQPPARRRPSSALVEFVRERLVRGRPDLYQRLARWGVVTPLEPERPATELQVYRKVLPPLLQFAWRRTLLILEALQREVQARGGQLLLVYVPAAFEVDERTWELTRLRYGFDQLWDRDGFAQRAASATGRQGLEFMDLTPPLRRAQRRAATYFTYDPHWNARGHAVAAAAVAERLRAGGVSCPG